MIHLGKVKPGTTIYIPFETFASSTGAPITLTGLAVGDIKVYKDGGTTERASTSGFTLLDTDGIDFDALTGIHGVSIDLSDNTTADFWAAGSRYIVVIGDVTVDSQTMRFIAAMFTIGYEGALLDTTIATLASQTSFTLTAGPADNNALIGCMAVVHDAASAVQVALGVVSAYTGSTKTVTLAADPGIFTMAAKDNISFLPRVNANLVQILGTAVSTPATAGILDVNVKNIDNDAASASGTVTFPNATLASTTNITAGTITTATNVTTVNGLANDVITAASIAADAIGASELAADAVAEIADGVWDELRLGHTGLGTFGQGVASVQGNVTGSVASVTGNVGGNVTGSVGSVVGAVGSVTGAVGSVTGNVGGNVTGSVGSVAAGGITAISIATGAIDADALAADAGTELATAILDLTDGVETSYTLRQALRLILSAAAAKLSGAATTSITIRDVNDSKNRIAATVDASGNRTAVTLDAT